MSVSTAALNSSRTESRFRQKGNDDDVNFFIAFDLFEIRLSFFEEINANDLNPILFWKNTFTSSLTYLLKFSRGPKFNLFFSYEKAEDESPNSCLKKGSDPIKPIALSNDPLKSLTIQYTF